MLLPLTAAASVSHGAGTDWISLMAEMIWVASAEASGCDTNTERHGQFVGLHVPRHSCVDLFRNKMLDAMHQLYKALCKHSVFKILDYDAQGLESNLMLKSYWAGLSFVNTLPGSTGEQASEGSLMISGISKNKAANQRSKILFSDYY